MAGEPDPGRVNIQVQVQVLRHGGVDELKEPQELLVAVPPVVLADDRAAGLARWTYLASQASRRSSGIPRELC